MQGYTRRQLKEDRFVETAQGAAEWTAAHRKPVIVSAVALIVVAAGTLGFVTWRTRQNEASNVALGAAMRVFDTNLRAANAPVTPENKDEFTSAAERGKAAEKQFKSVADQYAHTNAGHIARYLAGVAAMQAGDNAGAEQQLKAAADSGDKNIAALAKMALANYYRANNKLPDATRIYQELSDHPTDTVSKEAAQLAMADMYESTNPKEAASIYQKIQKENPDSPAAQTAAAKLTGEKAPE
ncbi:MAG TPA: tetratricopeptide repeat protein [Candidatus Angelobacter sp.]|nr:tetratricopeptide repeat protein [Candidatus Angelobacter sp.]